MTGSHLRVLFSQTNLQRPFLLQSPPGQGMFVIHEAKMFIALTAAQVLYLHKLISNAEMLWLRLVYQPTAYHLFGKI